MWSPPPAQGQAALGRPELFSQLAIATAPVPAHDGPIAGLALDGEFLGWLLLADSTKPEARHALAELRELGLGRQLLLTGGAGGADIALASADVVLIGSDLRRLGTCVRLSRQCRRTLQVNVVIGLGWTLAIVAAAAFGWLGVAGGGTAAQPQHLAGTGQCGAVAALPGAVAQAAGVIPIL